MKLEIKYGIITGVGICLWVLMEYTLGFHNERLDTGIGRYSDYFASIIPIVALFMAIKTKRDKYNKGLLSLKDGLKTGLLISLVSAFITTIFFYIYNNYINPGWIEMALEVEKNNMLAAGASKESIEEKMAQYKGLSSGVAQAASIYFSTVLMGLIYSLIISFILRRTHKEDIGLEM